MLSWVSVNASTGNIIADLPTLRVQGPLKQTLMRYESQQAHLPMGDRTDEARTDWPPPNWVTATRKGAAFLVALSEPTVNEPRGMPLWGGMVVLRSREVGDGARMNLVTAEAYFDRVYVGDEEFVSDAQNIIVKTLAEKYAKTGAKRGLPLRVEIIGGDGVARNKTFKDAEDKTLYSVMMDMSGELGGSEWTVRWEWVNERQLGLVLTVSDRIGSPAPSGLQPAAQFYLPGSVTKAELVEGYSSDEAANDVMAVSSGLGAARPQSPHQTNATDLRPRFEYRWTPETNVSDVNTLISHAKRALAAMKDGSLALTMTANREEAPQLGVDWHIGDDIGFSITAPEFPRGLTGVARAVGWELTDNTITPLIDVTDIEGID